MFALAFSAGLFGILGPQMPFIRWINVFEHHLKKAASYTAQR